MHKQEERAFAAFIGIDWADKKHDICLQVAGVAKRECWAALAMRATSRTLACFVAWPASGASSWLLLQIIQTLHQVADRALAPRIGGLRLEPLKLALKRMLEGNSVLFLSCHKTPLGFSKVGVQAFPRGQVTLWRDGDLVTQVRTFATTVRAERSDFSKFEPANIHSAVKAHKVVVGWHQSGQPAATEQRGVRAPFVRAESNVGPDGNLRLRHCRRPPSQYGTTGSSSPSRGLRFELRHQKRRAAW